MSPGLFQKPESRGEIPIRNAIFPVTPRNAVKNVPVCNEYATRLPDAVAVAIDVMGLGATAVVLEDGEVPALFEIFDRRAFDIIAAEKETPRVMAQVVEDAEKAVIFFVLQAHEFAAAAEIEGRAQCIFLALFQNLVQLTLMP